MIAFDPIGLGLNVIQDSSPGDSLSIVYLPSIVSDVTGAVPQLESESSARSFMQDVFRMSTENMYDNGLVFSGTI